ncbi:MAG TPA: hypothetical protein VKB23_04030 [Solirubrobacterales bacterium]|nr:hypothetical protein [Solirubrobacterales bacterium]
MRNEANDGKSPPDRHLVVVSAKRLDSDETEETAQEVPPMSSDAVVRTRLADTVSSLYPSAEFRSFSGAAATFLAPKLLIVAVYRPGGSPSAPPDAGGDSQQQLFAA